MLNTANKPGNKPLPNNNIVKISSWDLFIYSSLDIFSMIFLGTDPEITHQTVFHIGIVISWCL